MPSARRTLRRPDPVPRRGAAGAQVDESVREADLGVNFQEEVGDARLREALVEIEDELVGSFRNIGGEPVDVETAVTNDAGRGWPRCGPPWRVCPVRMPSTPAGRPATRRRRAARPERHCSLWPAAGTSARVGSPWRRERGQPDVAGPEAVT